MENDISPNFVQLAFDFDVLSAQPINDGPPRIGPPSYQKKKYCSKCKQWWPATLEYWHRSKMHKDGLHSVCKTCYHDYYVARNPHPCVRCRTQVAIRDHLCDECYTWKQSNPHLKYCQKCKQWLPTNLFDQHNGTKDGLRCYCKPCRHNDYIAHPEHNRETAQKRREDFLAKTPEEQEEVRNHIRIRYRNRYAESKQSGMCYSCFTRPPEPGRSLCEYCRASDKRYGEELRNEVFAAYGGKCAVCEETNPAFLSIDHINNDGANHRRATGGGHRLYLWLRKNNFPQENFQLLCANHNWLKHLNQQSSNHSQESSKSTYMKIGYAKLRGETMAAYGGKCTCCGETQTDVLAIDHVNNDGAKHRKETGGGGRFYAWLRNHDFPQEGFQILCFNCNRAKYYYGVCPHQQ